MTERKPCVYMRYGHQRKEECDPTHDATPFLVAFVRSPTEEILAQTTADTHIGCCSAAALV